MHPSLLSIGPIVKGPRSLPLLKAAWYQPARMGVSVRMVEVRYLIAQRDMK